MIRDYMSSTPSPALHQLRPSTVSNESVTYETPVQSASTPQSYDGYRISTPGEETPEARGKVRGWLSNIATTAVLTWATLTHIGHMPPTAAAAKANVAAHNVGLSGPVAAAVSLTVEASQPRAILPNGQAAPPTTYSGGYHGTSEVPPEVALTEGLPGRGDDWRLYEHAVAQSDSAFRGTTQVIYDPVNGGGAAAWAGDGGWVYDVRGVPTWDVNSLLDGRVPSALGGFTGNLMYGENEHAIPARVPPENIKRYARVVEDYMGRPRVQEWIDNPNFKP